MTKYYLIKTSIFLSRDDNNYLVKMSDSCLTFSFTDYNHSHTLMICRSDDVHDVVFSTRISCQYDCPDLFYFIFCKGKCFYFIPI